MWSKREDDNVAGGVLEGGFGFKIIYNFFNGFYFFKIENKQSEITQKSHEK